MTEAEFKDRNEMWQNFFHACEMGTVVQDYCNTIWQKRGAFMWQMIGSSDQYSQDSIQWPADVLRADVG